MFSTPGQDWFRNLRGVHLVESVVSRCRVSYLSRTSSEIYCCFMVICYRECDFSKSQCATSLGPTRIGESESCTRQSQNGKNENSAPTTPIANDSNTTTKQGLTGTTRYNWYTSKFWWKWIPLLSGGNSTITRKESDISSIQKFDYFSWCAFLDQKWLYFLNVVRA